MSDPSTGDTSRDPVFRAPAIVLALLALTAGFADGYALTRFDVFVANQSGNVVRVGMGLVGEYAAWDLALLSMLGFGIGGMLSWLVARVCGPRHWPVHVLRLIAVILLVLVWWIAVIGVDDSQDLGRLSAFAGAMAMGVTATILTHVAGVRAQPAYQSANVLSSFQGLLDWILRSDPVHRTGRLVALVGGLTLACYALGGAVGAVMAGLGPGALLVVLAPLIASLLLSRSDRG
jgi:uncharacterized membrane protein YoaK (UPF0700 family)